MSTKKKNTTLPATQTDSGDEATTKRVRDHFSNEKDVITAEDIKNAKTVDLEKTFATTDAENKNAENNEELMKEKIRDNEDNDIDTSWNVLESE